MPRCTNKWRLALLVVIAAGGASSSASGQVEDAPAFTRFPQHLAKNFASLWNEDNLIPLMVGAAGTAAVIGADDTIVNYFRVESHWSGFEDIGREAGKSQYVGPAIAVALLSSRLTKNVGFRKFTYDAAQGFIVTNVATAGIKHLSQDFHFGVAAQNEGWQDQVS